MTTQISTTVPSDGLQRDQGLTVPAAAVVAGIAYLLNPVSYAEFSIYPKLVIPHNIAQTAQNIAEHSGLIVAAIFCYLINFIGDIVLAWALFVLLAPVNRSVSLLAAWFQLVYAAVALVATTNLISAYHLVSVPEFTSAFGAAPLHAQLMLLLHGFRYTWSTSLVLFGIHLVLIGTLIYRSTYIPKWIGILLVINGVGWVVDSLGPYLTDSGLLDYTFVTFFGEFFFMFWLLIRGWKIPREGLMKSM